MCFKLSSCSGRAAAVFCFLAATVFLWPSACRAQDKIAAIVNSQIITSKELNDYAGFMRMERRPGAPAKDDRQLLDKLIEDRLILQEAKKKEIKVDESRVKSRLEEIKKRYPNEDAFQQSLREQGLAQQDVEDKLREQMLMFEVIDKQVRGKISITPQEITAFFEEDKKLFEISEERGVEYIVAPEEAKAGLSYSALKAGKSFKQAAEEQGISNGVLQIARNGKFRKAIEDVVFNLKSGEISYPLKTENEFYIFKVVKVIPPRQQQLTDVSDEIRDLLFSRKFEEELTSWVEKLKSRAYIKIKI
jgi:parvulin-like peptidyl-prolyl isomerase